jgi:hypothetical protein
MKITRCAVDLVLFADSAVREVAVEHGGRTGRGEHKAERSADPET